MKLLAGNYKLNKDAGKWVITGLSLAPHTVAGGPTVCPHSTPECRAVCLGTETGLNVLPSALKAKIARTRYFLRDEQAFKGQLFDEVGRALKSAKRKDYRLAVRLNVYSDIRWEDIFPELFHGYDDVQFYDYTKVPVRFLRPDNYHLTYSYSGTAASIRTAHDYLAAGVNVAVVMPITRGVPLPAVSSIIGGERIPVVDGDINDFRPGDPHPCIVGLRFKGPQSNLVTIKRFVQQGATP